MAGSTYGFRCIGLGKLIEHFASRAWSLKPGNLPASASEIVLVAFYVSLVANHVEHMKRQIRNSTENHESESNPLQHAEKSIIGGASPLSMFLALWYREQLSAEQIAAVRRPKLVDQPRQRARGQIADGVDLEAAQPRL